MDDNSPRRQAKLLTRGPERLHHYAFVIRDQEVNRQFFEDILGIPLVATWCEKAFHNVLKRDIEYCHTFYGFADGGAIAFFQYADDDAYEKLKPTNASVGHHISFKVDEKIFAEIETRVDKAKIDKRVIDHGYCKSIYLNTPDGLRLEFTFDPPDVEEINALRAADAHSELARWLKGDRRINNDIRH